MSRPGAAVRRRRRGWPALLVALSMGCVPAFEPLGDCVEAVDCPAGASCQGGRCARFDGGLPTDGGAPVDGGLAPVDGGAPRRDGGAALPWPVEDYALLGAPTGEPPEPPRFLMGSPQREVDPRPASEAQRSVRVRRLWVKVTELTRDDWDELFPGRAAPQGFACEAGADLARCPVGGISPGLAAEVANQASARFGFSARCYAPDPAGGWSFAGADCGAVRLPVQGEWEYVARAGVLVAHHGRTSGAPWSTDDVAWCARNVADGRLRPVGRRALNGHGLADVLGNVAEWAHLRDATFDLTLRGGSVTAAEELCRFAAKQDRCDGDDRHACAGLRLVVTATASNLAAPPEGFVEVPGGVFVRGSPAVDEAGRRPDEYRHQVTIARPFWLKRTEVTRAEWRALMGTDHAAGFGRDTCPDRCPVHFVSWAEAARFANALSARHGFEPCYPAFAPDGLTAEVRPGCTGFRLPTEAEWEFAARAGSIAARPDDLDRGVWASVAGAQRNHPTVVGRPGTANAFGLHDMLGNVWEWVDDDHAPYPLEPTLEPRPVPPRSTEGERRKIIRGCSYTDGEDTCRFARREPFDPAVTDRAIGFRLARTATSADR